MKDKVVGHPADHPTSRSVKCGRRVELGLDVERNPFSFSLSLSDWVPFLRQLRLSKFS